MNEQRPAIGIRTAILGSTGLAASEISLGTSALGRVDKMNDHGAADVINHALASGITVIDTGNNYGESERRIGLARPDSGWPGSLLVTKVDPVEGSSDFSGSRVRQSIRESMNRLGVDHLELVHLHDPERISFESALAANGPVRALLDLRERGLIGHIGVAGGPIGLLQDYIRTGHFESVVTHNRFTLMDQSAVPLLDLCAENSIGVFNAAPFGGGFLAGSGRSTDYCYRPASAEQLTARDRMFRLCSSAGVDLAAVALQFSIREPRIGSTIVGMSSPAQVEQTLERLRVKIPAELFSELRSLTPSPAGWFGADRI
ncbi:D-threo-aldose 1-dehydrogenase [Nakamurella sp. UYEF19]|uniref:aldo/keto reductase n=1 Tax=Nakamurella sp. UYEF19 TaxID=1756392 RepID=UPI0033953B56